MRGRITSSHRHITVNAVTNLLPKPVQKLCVAFSLLAVIVFSVIVTYWGWDIFHDSYVRGRTTGSLMNLPVWITELSVPVGFALLTAQAVVELIGINRSGLTSLGGSHE